MWKLKNNQESFEIMSGEDEGKKFVRGRAYDKIPAGYEDRFEKQAEDRSPKAEGKPKPEESQNIKVGKATGRPRTGIAAELGKENTLEAEK